MEECAELARELAQKVSRELQLPTFLYGSAATSPERELLSDLRKGQYEGLKERLDNGGPFLPDFGPRIWNQDVAKFGAVVIGARKILVAYNVNVKETDAKASRIAGSLVRTTGRLLKQDDGRKTRIPGMLSRWCKNGFAIRDAWYITSLDESSRCFNHAYAYCV